MSLMTTWTTAHVPPRPVVPEQLDRRHDGPQTAWDCGNCSLLNPGSRRRCTDCGTRRDLA